MKHLLFIIAFFACLQAGAQYIPFKQINGAPGAGYVGVSTATGNGKWVPYDSLKAAMSSTFGINNGLSRIDDSIGLGGLLNRNTYLDFNKKRLVFMDATNTAMEWVWLPNGGFYANGIDPADPYKKEFNIELVPDNWLLYQIREQDGLRERSYQQQDSDFWGIEVQKRQMTSPFAYTEFSGMHIMGSRMDLYPFMGNLYIDTLKKLPATASLKTLGWDTVSGKVGYVDAAVGGSDGNGIYSGDGTLPLNGWRTVTMNGSGMDFFWSANRSETFGKDFFNRYISASGRTYNENADHGAYSRGIGDGSLGTVVNQTEDYLSLEADSAGINDVSMVSVDHTKLVLQQMRGAIDIPVLNASTSDYVVVWDNVSKRIGYKLMTGGTADGNVGITDITFTGNRSHAVGSYNLNFLGTGLSKLALTPDSTIIRNQQAGLSLTQYNALLHSNLGHWSEKYGMVQAVGGDGVSANVTMSAIGTTNSSRFYIPEWGFVFETADDRFAGGVGNKTVHFQIKNLPVHADNAAAAAAGVQVGVLYRTSTGDLKVRY